MHTTLATEQDVDWRMRVGHGRAICGGRYAMCTWKAGERDDDDEDMSTALSESPRRLSGRDE